MWWRARRQHGWTAGALPGGRGGRTRRADAAAGRFGGDASAGTLRRGAGAGRGARGAGRGARGAGRGRGARGAGRGARGSEISFGRRGGGGGALGAWWWGGRLRSGDLRDYAARSRPVRKAERVLRRQRQGGCRA
ncbi:hypothetical protein GEV43_14515 [Actinomadura sp. J1-007]|nr:hypothetical protein [Actinomadura sp. J1-007]